MHAPVWQARRMPGWCRSRGRANPTPAPAPRLPPQLTCILRHGRNVLGKQHHRYQLVVLFKPSSPQRCQGAEVVHPGILERLGARRQQPGCRHKLFHKAGVGASQAGIRLQAANGFARSFRVRRVSAGLQPCFSGAWVLPKLVAACTQDLGAQKCSAGAAQVVHGPACRPEVHAGTACYLPPAHAVPLACLQPGKGCLAGVVRRHPPLPGCACTDQCQRQQQLKRRKVSSRLADAPHSARFWSMCRAG